MLLRVQCLGRGGATVHSRPGPARGVSSQHPHGRHLAVSQVLRDPASGPPLRRPRDHQALWGVRVSHGPAGLGTMATSGNGNRDPSATCEPSSTRWWEGHVSRRRAVIKGSHEPGTNPPLPPSRNQHCPATRQREELAWALRTTAPAPASFGRPAMPLSLTGTPRWEPGPPTCVGTEGPPPLPLSQTP